MPATGEGERHSKATAAALLRARVDQWAARMGLRHGRVCVKSQRTLWGSCSAKGNLNFNWRLAFAPPQALDYVVIHELAHLRELNHSKRFWKVVEEYCPDFRAHRRWLNDNHRDLYRSRECYNNGAERPEGRSVS